MQLDEQAHRLGEIKHQLMFKRIFFGFPTVLGYNPFRAPEPLPILNPSIIVPKNGFPVVKGLRAPVTHKTF